MRDEPDSSPAALRNAARSFSRDAREAARSLGGLGAPDPSLLAKRVAEMAVQSAGQRWQVADRRRALAEMAGEASANRMTAQPYSLHARYYSELHRLLSEALNDTHS